MNYKTMPSCHPWAYRQASLTRGSSLLILRRNPDSRPRGNDKKESFVICSTNLKINVCRETNKDKRS